ncbi:serine/threonine-protein phosphatase 4 regulatory subunit 2 [Sitophilus oryzae]|uniref:Serine/threonine-protein phosphatase 4 regulatory subunit 2 n=1 Tax=Sitophilus oryzae TaxID=7048 RepID=A0A6J2Y9R6_SITOR|nr:serine/threonine-protein phosphatase 4 regulatory subunit 2 [Sitophilus oryzae]
MENPEEILHSLEEFAKLKSKDIPRELEEYLKFVAKTGDPIYQWPAIKSLFREKLINVITEFYESCASMEIPPCPNVDIFNYDLMKSFILDKLDTFSSAPFTLQRICELLTSPRKEYTRIDKYMRALEKNILVVSTMEPGGRRTENGEGIMNGIESDHDHVPEPVSEINVEEMDKNIYINYHEEAINNQLPFQQEVDKIYLDDSREKLNNTYAYTSLSKDVLSEPTFVMSTSREEDTKNTLDSSQSSNMLPFPAAEGDCNAEAPVFPSNILSTSVPDFVMSTSRETYTSKQVTVTSEASTSSQDVVCVQYVSIGPLSPQNVHQNPSFVEDVSVTITGVNVEKLSEIQESKTGEKTEDEAEINQESHEENETEYSVKMDIQPAEATPSDSSNADSCETSKSTPQENVKIQHEKEISETSITCSEVIPNQSGDLNEVSNSQENHEKIDMDDRPGSLVEDGLGTVDSTTACETKFTETSSDAKAILDSQVADLIPVESSVKEEDSKLEADSSTICKPPVDTESEASTSHIDTESEEKSKSPEHSTEHCPVEVEKVSSLIDSKPTSMDTEASLIETETMQLEEAESSHTVD